MEQALIFETGNLNNHQNVLFWLVFGVWRGWGWVLRPPDPLLCISIAVPSIVYAKTDLDTSPFYLAMATFGNQFRLEAENHTKSVRGGNH